MEPHATRLSTEFRSELCTNACLQPFTGSPQTVLQQNELKGCSLWTYFNAQRPASAASSGDVNT
jgi:hypothetical protein